MRRTRTTERGIHQRRKKGEKKRTDMGMDAKDNSGAVYSFAVVVVAAAAAVVVVVSGVSLAPCAAALAGREGVVGLDPISGVCGAGVAGADRLWAK